MKNSQKGFVIPLLITIIALLGIGGGAYVYTKNVKLTDLNFKIDTQEKSSSVSNKIYEVNNKKNKDLENNSVWKTYTNSNNGIEFKYPKEATITPTSKSGDDLIIYIDGITSKSTSSLKYTIKSTISIGPSFVKNYSPSPEIKYSSPTLDGIVLGRTDWVRDLDKLGGGWSLEKSYWGDKGGYSYSISFDLYGTDDNVDLNTIENDVSVSEAKIIFEKIVNTINIKQREIHPIIGITAPYKDSVAKYKLGSYINILWHRNKEVDGGIMIDLIDSNDKEVSQSITHLGVAGPDMIIEGSPYKLNTKGYPTGKYKIRISNYGKGINEVSADSGWFILE